MPRKPKRPCSVSGCPNLCEAGTTLCDKHKKLNQHNYNKYYRDVKYDARWRKIRSSYVATHPLCERCLKEGRLTPVAEVHHIVPLRDGGSNDFSNLMSLCRHCHSEVHIELGDRKNF